MSAAEAINLDDVDALRAALADIAKTSDPSHLVDIVVSLLLRLSNENKSLQLRLQKAMRGLHGRKSEKLSEAQLALFCELIAAEEGEPAPASSAKREKVKRKAAPHGRGKFSENCRAPTMSFPCRPSSAFAIFAALKSNAWVMTSANV
jgi:hypothetical protein